MIRRYATPIALASAVAIYLVLFLLLGNSDVLLRIAAPAALAAMGAIGVKFMLSRDQAQIEDDNYRDDAKALASKVKRDMAVTASMAGDITDAEIQSAIRRASRTVPEMLSRVEEDQPNSLYSSASKFDGHVASLKGVVESYVDITRHPDYYKNASILLEQGKQAILRFDEFTIETMQLLTQGDMAEYQANLDTVAPPAIPKLEG